MTGGLLAIFAHPDDETFGCGGTLALHSEKSINVGALSLTCSDTQRGSELRTATKALGINEPIILEEKTLKSSPVLIRQISDIIVESQPAVVITHLPYDYHREHRMAFELVKEAIEWAAHTTTYSPAWTVKRLLLMEVNSLISNPHIIVNVSDSWQKKKAAFGAYTSQLAKFQWGYYQRFMEKKAELRGIQGGCKYAEAFLEEPVTENSPFYIDKSTNSLL